MNTFVIIFSLFIIAAGSLLLIAAVKNRGLDKKKRGLAYIISEILGKEGTRVFVGILGVSIILYGFFFFFENNTYHIANKKTDTIWLENKTKIINSTTISSSLQATISVIENNSKIELENYVKISLRNNYLEKIPEIIWKMKNLEEIDFTNNKFKSIPIKKLEKLQHLKLLILTKNPIDSIKTGLLLKKNKFTVKY